MNEGEATKNLTPLQQHIYNYEVEISGEDFANEELENIKKLNNIDDVKKYYGAYRGWDTDKDFKYDLIRLIKTLKSKKLAEGGDEDKLPLTPKMKKFIDKVISDAKKDGEFEELVQVDYFENDLIDFILEKFDDESDYDDVSQEVKDYINKSVKDYYRNPDGTPYFSEDLNEDSDENYDIFMDGVLDVLVKDKLITKADIDALNSGGADNLMDALHDEWEGFKNYEETGQAISRSDLNLAARAVAKKIGKLKKEDYAGAEEEKMMDFLAEKDKKEEGYMGTQYDSSEDMAVDMLKKGITEKEKEELRKKVQEILDEAVKKALEETPGSKIKETPKTEGEERYERDQADYTEDVEQPKSPTEGLSDEAIREFRKQLERETQKLTQTDDEGYDYFISRRSELAPLITRLEETLRAIFYRRKNSKYQRGKEGNRINIETRIQERAQKISVADSRAWERKEAPAEKDYAITLLIDLSGSMSVNIEDTIDALIVLAEALNQLGIKIEILGFNNEIFEFKNFDEVLNKDVRSRFHRAIEEVNYSYRAAYNDDGWAVLTSNERLIKRKESEKIMIVLSDGEPFPSTMHSGPEYELRRCIQSILSSGQLATLIGLGIGPGTQHVSRYYPNSRQQIRVQDLPKELSDVLVAAIDK